MMDKVSEAINDLYMPESGQEEYAELAGRVKALCDFLMYQKYETVNKNEVLVILGIKTELLEK